MKYKHIDWDCFFCFSLSDGAAIKAGERLQNLDFYSTLMIIGQRGSFDTGHSFKAISEDWMTFTPVAKCWTERLSLPVFIQLRSVADDYLII